MARIWYSVQGHGLGHAFRSDIVLDYLKDNHDIIITAGKGRAYEFLKKKYREKVHEIECENWIYENNEAKIGKSVKEFIKQLPQRSRNNIKKITKLITEFKPEIIISDYEADSHHFAKLLRIPCISLDNIHILTECKINVPPDSGYNLKSVKLLMRILQPKSDFYILPAYSKAKPKNKKNTFVVEPILRKDVLNLKPEKGDYVFVYQTSSTNKEMVKIFSKRNTKYVMYGMGNKKNTKNIKFKQFSEKGILEDIRKSKYVVVNGGFTVITEALYLKKPILALPIANQFEQEYNGYSLREMGYGDYTMDLKNFDLDAFESKLPFYEKNLKKLGKWNNDKLFKTVDRLIKKHKKTNANYNLLKKIIPKKW